MKLTLDEKVKRDLALNQRELVKATGYGLRAIKRIAPPFVEGKIRLSEFWKHVEASRATLINKVVDASPERSDDLLSVVDRLREPQPRRAPQAASSVLA